MRPSRPGALITARAVPQGRRFAIIKARKRDENAPEAKQEPRAQPLRPQQPLRSRQPFFHPQKNGGEKGDEGRMRPVLLITYHFKMAGSAGALEKWYPLQFLGKNGSLPLVLGIHLKAFSASPVWPRACSYLAFGL